jgi:hypothetical protein
MGLYDGIKDVAKVLQKADNIDLYKQLLDLSSQALELQNEVAKLQSENISLKKELEVEDDIERYENLFVTRKSDDAKIKYCSHCWDAERKLIQVDCYSSGGFRCPHCKTNGVYDREKYSNRFVGSVSSAKRRENFW